jgi:HK97 family phage major capsid protein
MNKQAQRLVDLERQIQTKASEVDRIKEVAKGEQRQVTEDERALWAKLNKELLDLIAERDLEDQEMDAREKMGRAQRNPTKPELINDESQNRYPGLPPKHLRFADFGEQLRAIMGAGAGTGTLDARLNYRAPTGMNEANPSDGGFLVQTDFAAGILQRAYDQSAVLSRVRKIPIGSNSNGIKLNAFAETSRASSILGGIIPYWVGEGYDKTDTMPQFRQIELSLKKLCCLWYATDEVLSDATALGSIAERGFAEAIDVELERVIVRGTGAGQPLGILTSPALISVTRAQVGNTISATDVIAMFARFRGGANSVWLASRSIIPQLFAIQLNDNLLYTPPSTGLREAPGGSLFGYPVLFVENCSGLGTVGDLILASLDDYLLATKGGVQMASSIHVKFVSDQSTFRAVIRVDGQPWDNSALTPKDSSATVGPFVALTSA